MNQYYIDFPDTYLALGFNFLCPHSMCPFLIYFIFFPGFFYNFCFSCVRNVDLEFCQMELIQSHCSPGHSCCRSIYQSLKHTTQTLSYIKLTKLLIQISISFTMNRYSPTNKMNAVKQRTLQIISCWKTSLNSLINHKEMESIDITMDTIFVKLIILWNWLTIQFILLTDYCPIPKFENIIIDFKKHE